MTDADVRRIAQNQPKKNRKADQKRNAKKTYPKNPTPKQAAAWERHSGRYDIKGVDTVLVAEPIAIIKQGKGRGGGKPRMVPISSQFTEILPSFRAYRRGIILEAIARKGGAAIEVPDNLYLNIQGKKLCRYSEHGVGFDKAYVLPVREKMGFDYGNHTLRRTFGRQLWKNGVEIETIAKILGHENTKTTLEYIGANLDDMKFAISRLSFD